MEVDRNFLLRQAWSQGNLEYQVEDYQLPVYEALWGAITDKNVLKYVCNISRRFGKTHLSSIIAIEFAIQYPGAQINYATGTNKAMNKILRSIIPVILQDCPKDLLPKRINGVWEFPNGSTIHTAGVNNQNADALRGTSSDLNIVDEAGQIDELEYLVRSVLLPQQLTVKGTMLLLSTPPSVTDHDYAKIYYECKEEGNLSEFTVYDNAKIMSDPELFQTYVKESGGTDSTHWKREYEVKFVTDTNKIIIPEWDDRFIVQIPPTDKFKFWKKYVSMDLGFSDFTILIFGYYDFERAKLVIQAEKTLVGEEVTSAAIAEATKINELTLWGGPDDVKRIADNSDNIVLNDINRVHKVLFNPTSKDSLMAMINALRSFIGDGRLEIYPECTYLLGCLEFGVWNKNRDSFAKSKKFGHYDGLAALVYLVRNLDQHTNPVPPMYGLKQDDVFFSGGPLISKNNTGLRGFNQRKRTFAGVK